MAEHNELGKSGEDLAANFLSAKGYKILERNWRIGHNEIDIIAQDANTLVIVEVKTLKSKFIRDPEASVGKPKQKSLINAANAYIKIKNISLETRFDIVSIVITSSQPIINHIPDAFYPTIR